MAAGGGAPWPTSSSSAPALRSRSGASSTPCRCSAGGPPCRPPPWRSWPPWRAVTLVDENVEAIDYDRCAQADIVGLTGMSVQRGRMRAILTELKRRGVFTVVGGPWVTVEEEAFGPLADVVFVGEAETTWPLFLAEWAEGRHQHR